MEKRVASLWSEQGRLESAEVTTGLGLVNRMREFDLSLVFGRSVRVVLCVVVFVWDWPPHVYFSVLECRAVCAVGFFETTTTATRDK